jgi:hypothetical protein
MHQFRIDEWVIYHQFPDAESESLREGKRAVVLGCIDGKQYEIYIDDPNLDEKWRRKIVNEVNLKAIN